MTPPQRDPRHGCEAARKWRTAAPPVPSLRRGAVAPQPWPIRPHPTVQTHRAHCLPPPPPLFRTRHAEESAERPHLITVVRPSGQSAMRKVTVLLNRRGVVSFEQLLLDISEALGFPRWHRARVTRLYTTYAREVKGICDFFRGDVAFLALGKSRPELSRVQEALEELFPQHPHYRAEALLVWDKKLRPAPDKASKADSGYSEGTDNGKQTQQLVEHPADTHAASSDTHQPGDCESDAQKPHRRTACRRAAVQPNHLQKLRVRGGAREPPPPPSDVGPFKHETPVLRDVDVPSPNLCENCLARRAKRPGPEWISPLTGRLPLPPVSRKQRGGSAAAPEERKSDAGEKTPPRLSNPPPAAETPPQKPAFDLRSDGSGVTPSDVERLYEMGRVVGDGNFAVVRECRWRGDGRALAAKIVERSKLIGREHMMQNELSLLASLCHPRIVRLFAHHHTRTHSYLLMELVGGGDLFEAISERGKFPEAEAGLMVSDVSEALSYIHGKHIVHRDVKPENLLIEHVAAGVSRLKLGDFGLAMVVTEPVFTICGTPTYVAPEILSETGYGVEVDVWALGVILYILLCGFPPFRSRDRDQEELFQIIKQAQLHFLSPYWDPISEEAKSLVRSLLQSDPAARMTAEQTLLHPWVKAMASTCSQRALSDKATSGGAAGQESERASGAARGGSEEEERDSMKAGRQANGENHQQESTQAGSVQTPSSKATPASNDSASRQIIGQASPNLPNTDRGKAIVAGGPAAPSPVTTQQSQHISPRGALTPQTPTDAQPQTATGQQYSSPGPPAAPSPAPQPPRKAAAVDQQAEKPVAS